MVHKEKCEKRVFDLHEIHLDAVDTVIVELTGKNMNKSKELLL